MSSSKLTRNKEVVLTQGMDLVDFYRNHPVIAAYDLLGVDLAPIQAMVLEDMWFKSYVVTVASRGLGKCVHVSEIINKKGMGLVHMNEVLPPVPSYLNPGEEIVIDCDIELSTANGVRPTKRTFLEKEIQGKQLVTQNGFVKRGSNHHL